MALYQHCCHQPQSSEMSLRSGQFDVESSIHIQEKRAVGADMTVDEGGEGSQIVHAQPLLPLLFAQDTLDHQSVDVDHRILQQV